MSTNPQQFPKVALGESFDLEYGAPMPERERTGNGYPVFGSNGVVGRHSRFLISGPGIVVGRKGSVGEVCWSNESFWPIDTAYYVVPEDGVDLRWLYWLLGSVNLRRLDAATGVPGLNRNDVYDLKAHKPPPPDQSRIAAVLDTVDEAIAKTEAVIAKLRQVRAGLLHDLLTRGLDKNGQLRDPIAHPEQFQDSLLGQIPKDWDIRRLEELADIDRGKFAHRPRNEPRFYDGPYPFVQTGDIANAAGEVLTDSSQTLNGAGAAISREFPKNTIAITIAANIADTAILGRSMFLTDSVVGAIVKAPNNVRFIELCIRRAKPKLQARAPQTAQMNINLQDLRPLLVAIPKRLEEQHQISEIYEENARALNSQQINLVKLRRIKFGLMTDLLTGRVRVPETLATTS